MGGPVSTSAPLQRPRHRTMRRRQLSHARRCSWTSTQPVVAGRLLRKAIWPPPWGHAIRSWLLIISSGYVQLILSDFSSLQVYSKVQDCAILISPFQSDITCSRTRELFEDFWEKLAPSHDTRSLYGHMKFDAAVMTKGNISSLLSLKTLYSWISKKQDEMTISLAGKN